MSGFLKRDKALQQSPRQVFLVQPRDFSFNAQTASTNAFQQNIPAESKATVEFSGMEKVLAQAHIACRTFSSPPHVHVPDAVFPNNWIAVLPSGQLVLFPMMAANRRDERNPEIISWIEKHYSLRSVINLTHWENRGEFLEGTGSIVFDHIGKTAYACISPRTSEKVLAELCTLTGYTPFVFRAHDAGGIPVYHTNVMMNLGGGYAIVCLESVDDAMERALLKKHIEQSGRILIEISHAQMKSFAGNMLEVINALQDPCLIASQTAWQSLEPDLHRELERFVQPVIVHIPSIEKAGGGSARCMLAGIHTSPL